MLISLFWMLITLLSTFIEWHVFNFILEKISDVKRNKITRNIFLYIIILIITILSIFNVPPNIKIFIAISSGIIFYIYNYNVTLSKGIIVCLIYWMLLLSFDSISISIILTINSIFNTNEILMDNIYRLELIAISKAILLLLIPIIKVTKMKLEVRKIDLLYIFIPIVANILSIIITFSYAFKEGQNNSIENIYLLRLSILLLLSNISLVFIVNKFIKDNKLRLKYNMIKEKMESQYNYYMKLQNNHMQIRSLYHDMKNHLICLEHEYNNSFNKDYIKSINDKINDIELTYKTGNMILDIIISDKKEICKKYNIKLFMDVNFSKCDFIEMIDVCSIFSNILDNAIEACNKIKNENISKEIKLRGTIIKGFFVLKAENTKTNKIFIKNNKIISDKRNDLIHGMGIYSIKSSVVKYNGTVVIDYTEDSFIMNIYIPLQ